jgi:glycosyltransferase involved in cell wall biosynthesis
MRTLRLGIDAANIRRGGGRTHLIELLSSADPLRDCFSEISIWGSKETLAQLPDRSWLKKLWHPALDSRLPQRILWQRLSLANELRQAGCDVLFVPGGSFSTNFRPVVTMSQNLLPFDWFEILRYKFSFVALKLILLRLVQTRSFRQADGIIFLTEYAKQSVIRVTGQLDSQQCVIPHGLNSRFLVSEDALARRQVHWGGDSIRLIYVSIVDHYKHQWHVVEGVAKARAMSGRDLQLDLIGPAYKPALKRLNKAIAMHDPNNNWVKYHGPVEYQTLHKLYYQSHLGIWASSCETFGIILLEMMAAGLPILSSNCGPMFEILGDSALYFDAEQPDSLCEALLNAVSSKEVMKLHSLRAYGKARAYSWERCARETFKFLGLF